MTNQQRRDLIETKQSERRQKINDLLGVETRSEEQQTELETLTKDIQAGEVELRAAIALGDDPDLPVTHEKGDGEGAEIRQLSEKSELRSAIAAIANGKAISGPVKELAEARGLTELNALPWDVIAPRVEHRARVEHRVDTVTSDTADVQGKEQHTILQRVFAKSSTMALGVSMQSVGVGESTWPVIATGADAEFKAADGKKEAEAATFEPVSLAPVRLQSRYAIRREDLARIVGFEPAMRMDLSGSMGNTLDAQNLAGDGTGANLSGYLATAANGGLPAVAAPAVVTFELAAAQLAKGVDGKYAGNERDCSVVIGVDTYETLASKFQTGSGVAATSYFMKQAKQLMASANIPDKTNANVQDGILARLAGDDQMNAVSPVWEGVTILRDELTEAAKGWILITAVALYSFKILRPGGFQRLRFKLS